MRIPVSSLVAGLVLLACKSRQPAVAHQPFTPESKQMTVATAKWPGTTAETLSKGEAIYGTKCDRCHRKFEITRFGEKKWIHELEVMTKKAKLTPEETDQVTKYVLSYREAYTPPAAK